MRNGSDSTFGQKGIKAGATKKTIDDFSEHLVFKMLDISPSKNKIKDSKEKSFLSVQKGKVYYLLGTELDDYS